MAGAAPPARGAGGRRDCPADRGGGAGIAPAPPAAPRDEEVEEVEEEGEGSTEEEKEEDAEDAEEDFMAADESASARPESRGASLK